MQNHYIVYDVETQKLDKHVPGGWDNIFGMGLASAVTYNSKTDLYEFWKDPEKLCEYLNGNVVVGFNSIWFDSKVLLGNDRIIELDGSTKNEKYSWKNIDIYVEMWRNILSLDKSNYPEILKKIKEQKIQHGIFGLGPTSAATLNITKSGHGEDAPMLYQQGRFFELLEYNLQDVRVTKELYLFIKKYRYMVNGNYDIIQFK